MKAWDKEFYDLMNQFEKDMKNTPYRCKIERVTQEQRKKLPAGEYYNDGETNKLFNVYMMGYTYRKCLENLELLKEGV